jgi:hypothetical protein
MAQYGSQKAYAPADYRRELAGAAFHDTEAFVLRRQLRLDIAGFTGLALSSSHVAGVIEGFGIDGARSALRDAAPGRRGARALRLRFSVFHRAPQCLIRACRMGKPINKTRSPVATLTRIVLQCY